MNGGVPNGARDGRQGVRARGGDAGAAPPLADKRALRSRQDKQMTNLSSANAPLVGDAFAALLGQLAGLPGVVTYARDDGYGQVDSTNYISDWNDRGSWAIARAAGRVLDVGAGAGRVCLRLAESGLDAVALDVSAGAVEVCRRQGVQNVFHGTIDDLPSTELFDTFIVLGNNLGLIGSPRRLRASSMRSRLGCDRAGGSSAVASIRTRPTTLTTSRTTKRTSPSVGWPARCGSGPGTDGWRATGSTCCGCRWQSSPPSPDKVAGRSPTARPGRSTAVVLEPN